MRKIRVMQLTSNPEWAGCEVQVATLTKSSLKDDNYELLVTVFHNGRLADFLRDIGVKIEVVKLNWVFDFTAISRIARILKHNCIDILHTHGYKANVIGALAAKSAGVRHIVRTEHGLREPFSGLKLFKMMVYEQLDYLVGKLLTDRIIAVSNDVRRELQRKYPLNKIETIHNGIELNDSPLDINPSYFKKTLRLPMSAPIIGTIGRLTPVKGHEYFLRSAVFILEKEPEAKFLIVGDGPLRKDLELFSKKMGLADSVIFTGFQEDVRALLGIMDILVFSSLSEGIPYTLLEAMNLGIPVVGTKAGGLPEVIEDGVSGVLVLPKNEFLLAEACLNLLEDREMAKRIGIGGKKRVSKKFSMEQMWGKTSQVYKACLTAFD